MPDQPNRDESRPAAAKGQTAEGKIQTVPAPSPATVPGEVLSPADEPASVKNLSAEEQLALYEKDLKENDWGHQPC